MGRLKIEDDKTELAYGLYVSLGEKRTLEKVATLMGMSKKTIQKWSSDLNWSKRLQQEYKDIYEELKGKQLSLQLAGLEASTAAMNKFKELFEQGVLNQEIAKAYELILKAPLDSLQVETKSGTDEKEDTPQSIPQVIIEGIEDLEG